MGVETGTPDEALGAYLRCVWFSSIAEISDLDLQRRRWLDMTNTNPHWSYVEFVCSYPALEQLVDARTRGWISTRQFDILVRLRQRILSHSAPGGDDYDNAAVLADPAWLEVVAEAARVRQELLSMVVNEVERAALSATQIP
jgi:hypothetical protein